MYGANIEQVSTVKYIWVLCLIVSLTFRYRLIMLFQRLSDQLLNFVLYLMVEMDFP